jgi:hypothetical protein
MFPHRGFVLKGSDCERAPPAIGFGYVDPPGRRCPISSPPNPCVQVLEIALEVCFVGLTRQSVHAGCCVLLKLAERLSQQFGADEVEERGEPLLLPFPCHLPYALQRL